LIRSNVAGSHRPVSGVAHNSRDARVPTTAWTGEMVHGSTDQAFQLGLGIANLPLDFVRCQVREVTVRYCVRSDLEPKFRKLLELTARQESASVEESRGYIVRRGESLSGQQGGGDLEVAGAAVIERNHDDRSRCGGLQPPPDGGSVKPERNHPSKLRSK
jgi:hypothetical protein